MADEKLSGEWSDVTGPGVRVCAYHQSHAVKLALLEQRLVSVKEEFKEMCEAHRREHAANMRALEELRLSASKVGAKVGLMWAGAGTIGGALMALLIKNFGG